MYIFIYVYIFCIFIYIIYIVTVIVNAEGDMVVFVKGVEKDRHRIQIPLASPLFAVVDVHGNTKAFTIESTHPKEIDLKKVAKPTKGTLLKKGYGFHDKAKGSLVKLLPPNSATFDTSKHGTDEAGQNGVVLTEAPLNVHPSGGM